LGYFAKLLSDYCRRNFGVTFRSDLFGRSSAALADIFALGNSKAWG
jgi:hypothetical protein